MAQIRKNEGNREQTNKRGRKGVRHGRRARARQCEEKGKREDLEMSLSSENKSLYEKWGEVMSTNQQDYTKEC